MDEKNFYQSYINQVSEVQKAMDKIISPKVQKAIMNDRAILRNYFISSGMLDAMNKMKPVFEQYRESNLLDTNMMQSIQESHSIEGINAHIQQLNVLRGYILLHYYPDNMSNKAIEEDEKINNKVVEEIFKPESNNRIEKNVIITLSPINDNVLKYLSENPLAFYQLDDREFEIVMAEIYNKLGYEVELTKATRDGGKDIIIRKPEILGDFIYYVECKKNAPKRHIGIGIVKNLVGTISTDRVNGGILATTSYFTSDAKRFISDNKYDYQIQMHDYDMIRKLLDQAIE